MIQILYSLCCCSWLVSIGFGSDVVSGAADDGFLSDEAEAAAVRADDLHQGQQPGGEGLHGERFRGQQCRHCVGPLDVVLEADVVDLVVLDTDARVLDTQVAEAVPLIAAHRNAAFFRVADGIGRQVLDDLTEQIRIRTHIGAARLR